MKVFEADNSKTVLIQMKRSDFQALQMFAWGYTSGSTIAIVEIDAEGEYTAVEDAVKVFEKIAHV